MRQYVRYFRWIFIVTGILAVVYAGLHLLHSLRTFPERTNEECLTQQRVFDYGDILSEAEEEKLADLIAKRERQTGCDIVLVTLNESLKEYARKKEPYVPYEEFVRVYAEDFYDSNAFGYDRPIGDGVLLVDNWYREEDGRVYTWLSTVGRAEEKYTAARIDHLLDNVYRYVERDPYRAYKTYINDFYHDMAGGGTFTFYLPYWLPLAAAALSMLIFVVIHWNYKKGSKTVVPTAYVDGSPQMYKREDVFINKIVTKRHIQRSSGGSGGSGGGGGSHGGHHGGGGHSR